MKVSFGLLSPLTFRHEMGGLIVSISSCVKILMLSLKKCFVIFSLSKSFIHLKHWVIWLIIEHKYSFFVF
jgi:hypothetical protein